MSDRIAVMSQGRVEQAGDSTAIYERPTTTFVARFLGASNLVPGVVGVIADGQANVQLAGGPIARFSAENLNLVEGQAVSVMLRPEWLALSRTEPGEGFASAKVEVLSRLYQGAVTRWTVSGLGEHPLEVTGTPLGTGGVGDLSAGESGWLCWRLGVGALLPREQA